MGFFNNLKNIKDSALENEKIQNYDQLQGVFDAIDSQAEKEVEKDKKEREYFESLTPEQKIEYKRVKKRNQNLKKLGMYGLTAAGMATGVGVPVMMAAGAANILSDDSLTYNKDVQDRKLKKANKQQKKGGAPNKVNANPKPKAEYITINYDNKGNPIVSTLVDKDPYDLKLRYEELIRE